MRATRHSRLMRAGAAATVATLAALLSHLAAGGPVPGPVGVLAPWLLSLAVCVVLAGRALSLVRMALAVTVSQTLFHLLFVVGTIMPRGGMPGHHHDMLLTLPLGEAAGSGVGMSAAHLAAAAVTTALLYRGERALAQILDLARGLVQWFGRLVRRGVMIPAHRRAAVPRSNARTATLTPRLTGSVLRRRGPPALAAF